MTAVATPYLIADLAAVDRNIARALALRGGLSLRPHFKAHKCSTLLARQVAAGGCIGVTCATPGEALALASAGFDDILVANEVASGAALETLMVAAQRAHVTVAVDSVRLVELIAERARWSNATLGALIDVDVGHHRCGITPGGNDLLAVASGVARVGQLTLEGIMGYEGHAALDPDPLQRRSSVEEAGRILAQERDRLEAAGYPCRVVSGGATGTLEFAAQVGVLTEAQAGSYVLLDASYDRLALGFEPALYCVATVVSRRGAREAVLDAGLKAMSGEEGPPRATVPGLEITALHDEHAIARGEAAASLRVGDTVELVPAHVDPTMNLHDVIVARHKGGQLEFWPIDGRRSLVLQA